MIMVADWDYYHDEYHGQAIQSADEYPFFAEGAGDELAPFISRIPNTEEAQRALKRCACRITDIIYGDYKTSKYGYGGNKITSESVNGYYSVSFGNAGGGTEALKTLRRYINNAIALYLGKWILGPRKVIV